MSGTRKPSRSTSIGQSYPSRLCPIQRLTLLAYTRKRSASDGSSESRLNTWYSPLSTSLQITNQTFVGFFNALHSISITTFIYSLIDLPWWINVFWWRQCRKIIDQHIEKF